MKKLHFILVFGFIVFNAFVINSWAQETINFEGLPTGTIVDQAFGDLGSGPIGVFGENPNAAGLNAAVIFDSANPNGDPCGGGLDLDLGTPNENFGGPGVGAGGASGPFANMVAQGNILIINEVCGLGDNPVLRPNDADLIGAKFEFDFSGVGSGSATIHSITIIDVEADEPSATVELFDSVGGPLAQFTLPQTGDNGIAAIGLGPTPGVVTMVVTLNGSGAIDNIVFTPEDGNGGEGCTPGYWKNHLEDWPPTGLDPTDDFDTTFGVDLFDPDITLEEAVNAKGGGVKKLARHGTAALLSALHPDVDYPFSAAEVIAKVGTGDVDPLAAANELGCDIP